MTYVKEDDRPNDRPADFKRTRWSPCSRAASADLGDCRRVPGWEKIEPDRGVAAWTDDYSDIFGAILRKKLGQ